MPKKQEQLEFHSSDSESDSEIPIVLKDLPQKKSLPRNCKRVRVPTNPNINLNVIDDTYFVQTETLLLTEQEITERLMALQDEYYDSGIPFIPDPHAQSVQFNDFVRKWADLLGTKAEETLRTFQTMLDQQGDYLTSF